MMQGNSLWKTGKYWEAGKGEKPLPSFFSLIPFPIFFKLCAVGADIFYGQGREFPEPFWNLKCRFAVIGVITVMN